MNDSPISVTAAEAEAAERLMAAGAAGIADVTVEPEPELEPEA